MMTNLFPLRSFDRRSKSGYKSRARKRFLRAEALESRLMFAGPADDLAALSDEFEDPSTLPEWQRVNEVEGWNADQLHTWDIAETRTGRMTMQPHTVVWYQNWRGPMSFKSVTGDFVFTTEVHVTDRDDVGGSDADDVPGDAQFSLAGTMIRTPRDIQDPLADWQPGSMQDDGTNNGENYVFLSMGHGTNGEFTFEIKTTRNSDSQLELTPTTSNTATLRIARINDAIITLYRLPGQDWVVHRRYERPDMPETLQVGLVSYTDWQKASDFDPFVHNSTTLVDGVNDPTPAEAFNPDIDASFEYARFARPQVPDELQGVDLVNAATAAQLLSFLGDAPPEDPDPEPVENTMRVGVNLEHNVDWSSAWVFKDAFHRSRPWSARAYNPATGDTMWQFQAGDGPELSVDENGWITELPTWTAADGTEYQQRATTVIFTGDARQPAGIYRAEWEGTGELVMPFVVEQGETFAGRHYALIEMPAGAHFTMDLWSTDSSDPIRNIDLWMPDYGGETMVVHDWQPGDETSPFHPLFVERLQDFDTLRFMDWQRTNYSDVVTWDDRSTLDDASQADFDQPGYYEYLNNGVAVEYMVQLANEVDANPWFNMPHQADDDFVRGFATLVRDTLDPELDVYVEWSNELWNAYFPVNAWIGEQMQLPENAGLGFFQVAGQEIRRDFQIWTDVFAGQEGRLVRVVAGQQSTPWVLDQLLANTDGMFDAVSSTAYADLWEGVVPEFDENTTADEIIDTVIEYSLPWSRDRLAEHRAVADQYEGILGREIPLVTYESGSHIFAFGSPLMNSPALPAAVEAMYSPRMYDVYQTILSDAQDAGVDLYNEFTFTGHYGASQYGNYSLLHTMDQPLDEAHQLRSILDFIADQQPQDEADQVRFELSAVDEAGNPLSSLHVGQSFVLQVTVDDLRDAGMGVFSAYLDVEFDHDRLQISGPFEFSDTYPNAREGDTSVAGLIDEVGAVADLAATGADTQILVRIPMTATAAGVASFATNPADLQPAHEVTLYDETQPVPIQGIQFSGLSLEIVPGLALADDNFQLLNEGQMVSLDVLANDTNDPAVLDSWTIVSVDGAEHGMAAVGADGDHLVYTPDVGFYGEETLVYAVQDSNGQIATANVVVQLNRRWQNAAMRWDVSDDSATSPIDAMWIIRSLNDHGPIALPGVPTPAIANLPLVDVNNDQVLSALDVLEVINELNRLAELRAQGAAEGEAPFDWLAAQEAGTGPIGPSIATHADIVETTDEAALQVPFAAPSGDEDRDDLFRMLAQPRQQADDDLESSLDSIASEVAVAWL